MRCPVACPVGCPVALSQPARLSVNQAEYRRAAVGTDSQFLCFSLSLHGAEVPR